MSAAELWQFPYHRILVPDGGGYAAAVLEFPGCFAEGDTAVETLLALERAALAWIQAALDLGQTIPPPCNLRHVQMWLEHHPAAPQDHGDDPALDFQSEDAEGKW